MEEGDGRLFHLCKSPQIYSSNGSKFNWVHSFRVDDINISWCLIVSVGGVLWALDCRIPLMFVGTTALNCAATSSLLLLLSHITACTLVQKTKSTTGPENGEAVWRTTAEETSRRREHLTRRKDEVQELMVRPSYVSYLVWNQCLLYLQGLFVTYCSQQMFVKWIHCHISKATC